LTSSPPDTPANAASPRLGWLARARRWALLRIVLEAAALIGVMVGAIILSGHLTPPRTSPLHDGLAMARNLVQAGMLLGAYVLLVRLVERRAAGELSVVAGAAQAPLGVLIGSGMIAAVYLVLWAMGHAAFGDGDGTEGVALGVTLAVLAAVFEELLLRAVLFRHLEDAFGTTVALVVSAAIFGLLHSFNPGATAFSDIAIALEAGVLLALAYASTRNLWLAIGLHAGWNFGEGNIFGAQVSGTAPTPSLVHSTLTGPSLLTGGSFGPEASVVAIGVSAVVSVVFAVIIVRRGGWRPLSVRLSAP